MENVQQFGAANACAVLKAASFYQSYKDICINGQASDAYAEAGWVFWFCCSLLFVVALYSVRKAITFAFA